MFDWTKTNIPKPQNLAECEESGKLYSRLWVVPSFMYKYTSGNFPSIFIYLIPFYQQRHDFYQWLVCSAFKSHLGYWFVLCFSIFFIYLFLIFIPSVDRSLLYILFMNFFSHFLSLRLQQSICCFVSVGLLLPMKHTGYITFGSLNLIKYVLCFYVVASRSPSISETK